MNELATWASSFGLNLTDEQLAQFAVYEALLLEWNERIALTAIRAPRAIRIRHFLDSLSCATVTGPLDGQLLIDVGSGAGFPGLPLKILYPAVRLTLVDSVAKKTRFLELVVSELGLREVVVIADRAEALGQEAAHREQYDWVVARAVAELRVLAEYLLPLARVGGFALAQKGDSARTESAAATQVAAILGGGEVTITPIYLPETDQAHNLVVIPKIRPTPAHYPRRPGIPAKRPLKTASG
jgi:16S rRNA (guanine527-N7)-methyltransferase